MRLSGLSFSRAALLLFSLLSVSTLLAQHGGGGGGGSSAGSSGGGSHGGGGGGSFSGGGARSSSGSSSHGTSSASHNSGATASRGAGSSQVSSLPQSNLPRSNNQRIRDITRVSLIEPIASEATKAAPQKRGVFSFLRHPVRRQEEPAAFQHRVCWKNECRVCPIAQVPRAGSCATPNVYLRYANQCSHGEIWSGTCQQTNFAEDCSGLRAAMERQALRMQAAEAARQNACSSVFTQECTDLAGKAESEVNLYGALQQKFNQCTERSRRGQSYTGNLFSPHDFRDFAGDTDRP